MRRAKAIASVGATGGVACSAFGQGTIRGVAVGTGLTGGGNAGGVSLAVDTNAIQQRVSGSCTGNTFMQSIDAAGTVACSAPAAAFFEGRFSPLPVDNGSADLIARDDASPSAGISEGGTAVEVLQSGVYAVNVTVARTKSPFELSISGTTNGPPLLSAADGDPATTTRIVTLNATQELSVVDESGSAAILNGYIEVIRIA